MIRTVPQNLRDGGLEGPAESLGKFAQPPRRGGDLGGNSWLLELPPRSFSFLGCRKLRLHVVACGPVFRQELGGLYS
jgi:hypothetical protein